MVDWNDLIAGIDVVEEQEACIREYMDVGVPFDDDRSFPGAIFEVEVKLYRIRKR